MTCNCAKVWQGFLKLKLPAGTKGGREETTERGQERCKVEPMIKLGKVFRTKTGNIAGKMLSRSLALQKDSRLQLSSGPLITSFNWVNSDQQSRASNQKLQHLSKFNKSLRSLGEFAKLVVRD